MLNNNYKKLKFRFYDGENIIYPNYIDIQELKFYNSFRELENGTHIERCIIMQYTGLKDIDANDIYEGDILHTPHDTGFSEIVTFEDGAFQLKTNTNQGNSHLTQNRAKRLRIIGNIFIKSQI